MDIAHTKKVNKDAHRILNIVLFVIWILGILLGILIIRLGI
jgi:hypothetical protein